MAEYHYDGDYNDQNQRHGQGHAWFVNGDEYEGSYDQGRRHGHGIYKFANGATYEGNWHNGKKNGYGVFSYPDSSEYEGEWKDDMRHGRGRYRYVNGDVYDGEWSEHVRHGSGQYVYAINGIIYQGTWDRGVRVGQGTVTIVTRESLMRLQGVAEGELGFPGSEGLAEKAGRKAWWLCSGEDPAALECSEMLPEGGRDRLARLFYYAIYADGEVRATVGGPFADVPGSASHHEPVTDYDTATSSQLLHSKGHEHALRSFLPEGSRDRWAACFYTGEGGEITEEVVQHAEDAEEGGEAAAAEEAAPAAAEEAPPAEEEAPPAEEAPPEEAAPEEAEGEEAAPPAEEAAAEEG